MNKKRICFVSTSAYGYFNREVESVGGGDRQLSMVSRRLTDEFDVHFVVGAHGQAPREEVDGVTLHSSYTPDPDAGFLSNTRKFLKLFSALKRADADIYMYCGHPRKATHLYLMVRLLEKQWIYYLANDPNIEQQPAQLTLPVRKLFQRSLRDADAVVAQTSKQQSRIKKVYRLDAQVLPSGYEPVDDVLQAKDREHFLWVGRIRKLQKRPNRFLDVAEALPDEEFVMIGPPGAEQDYYDWIKERATNLPNVRFLGRVDEATLHDHYRRAIALVNTSDYEGFPSTFLEAWRYKTPVVSYTVGVGRFYDSASDPGCAGGDFDELLNIMARVIDDDAFRAEISRDPHNYFLNNLTIDSVCEQYRKLFLTV